VRFRRGFRVFRGEGCSGFGTVAHQMGRSTAVRSSGPAVPQKSSSGVVADPISVIVEKSSAPSAFLCALCVKSLVFSFLGFR
jgi:hypothetical protein